MTDWRDELRNPKCEGCDLHLGAETVCLVSKLSPPKADIVIVGEAPGQTEDEDGEPFIGSSGKYLFRALNDLAGIKRNQCYITNVAKCRPPNNRNPKRTELKECVSRYFTAELENVDPKFMLLLGNVPLQGVMRKSGIMKHHGAVVDYETSTGKTIKVMPTIHPAAVTRNPSWATVFASDIKRFGELVRGEEKNPHTTIKIVNTPGKFRWLVDQLDTHDVIAYDVETYVTPAEPPYKRTNFQEWHGNDTSLIVCIGFTWQEGLSAVVPLWHSTHQWVRDPQQILDALRQVFQRLRKHGAKLVTHNGKYDDRWLNAKGVPSQTTFCTMSAMHVIDENRPKRLDDLSRTELGSAAYGVGVDVANAYYEDFSKLAFYNGRDTDYTFRLRPTLKRKLAKDDQSFRIYKHLMMPANHCLPQIESTGVYLDTTRWKDRCATSLRNRAAIQAHITQEWVPNQLRPINLNSPQQVSRWLYEHLELPVMERTDKGQPSTRELVLLWLARDFPDLQAMQWLLKWRKWNKFLTTYLTPWWYQHRNGNRIMSTYNPCGTKTGRLSGKGGIQQVPQDSFIRSMLGSRPGWSFVSADYSQLELRLAAMIAHESHMLDLYSKDADLHTVLAAKVTGKHPSEVTKQERSDAKPGNFGFLYGMGAAKFVNYAFENYGVTYSQEESQRIRNAFFALYPMLRVWHDRQRQLAHRYYMVRSPIGRARRVPDIMSSDKKVIGDAERQAINFPVQSLGSDMMLLALVTLHPQLPSDQIVIVGTVHDALLFEIRNDVVYDWLPFIKETMEDVTQIAELFGTEITVPIKVDIEVGTHWGEGQPWQG